MMDQELILRLTTVTTVRENSFLESLSIYWLCTQMRMTLREPLVIQEKKGNGCFIKYNAWGTINTI